jgi:CRP-like cAMP-binding protein
VVALGETLRFAAETIGIALVPLALLLFGRRGAVIACGVLPIVVVALVWRRLERVDERANARVRLVDRIRALPLFASLRIVELERVVSALRTEAAPAGTTIVRENDPDADSFYVLDAGSATVSAAGRRLRELRPGDGFGEIALLHRVPRTASVTADEDVELLVLDRNDFLGALTGGLVDERARQAPPPAQAGAPLEKLLLAVPALAAAGLDERRAIAAQARVRDVTAGTVLCAQGDAARSLFVLLDGEIEVSAGGERLRVLGAGATFGEVGVLHDVVRTATVTALGPARVAEIDRDALRAAQRAD